MRILMLSSVWILPLTIACSSASTDEDEPGNPNSGWEDLDADAGDVDDDDTDPNDTEPNGTADDTEVDDTGAEDIDSDAGAAEGDADGSLSTDEECDSVLGTFSGLVILALEDEDTVTDLPAPNARVTVQPSDLLEDPITMMANTEGIFTTPLPADTYRVQAKSDGACESEWQSVDLVPCETTELTLYVTRCLDGSTGR